MLQLDCSHGGNGGEKTYSILWCDADGEENKRPSRSGRVIEAGTQKELGAQEA